MDRILNYVFILATIFLFIVSASAEDHVNVFAGIVLSVLFCTAAFLLKWLSLDGARAAAVIGTITVGFGGYAAVFLIIIFFVSSTFMSPQQSAASKNIPYSVKDTRRNGLQVWANGFWFVLFVMLAFMFKTQIGLVAAAAALATATSDTWATELGSTRFNATTYHIVDFKEVAKGTDGGVSVPGTLAALAGSFVISVLAIYVFSLNVSSFFIILVAGFSGCLADSYLGALLQNPKETRSIPSYLSKVDPAFYTNDAVNWAATGVGSIVALIFNLF